MTWNPRYPGLPQHPAAATAASRSESPAFARPHRARAAAAAVLTPSQPLGAALFRAPAGALTRQRMRQHGRQQRRPVLAQRLVAHEQPEVAARADPPHDVGGRRRRIDGEREDLIGRGDVVGRAGQQVQRHRQPAEVDGRPAHLQLTADQLVAREQVAHDPQVESARDVLGVLEPVLEDPVAIDVAQRRRGGRAGRAGARPRRRGRSAGSRRACGSPRSTPAAGRHQRLVEARGHRRGPGRRGPRRSPAPRPGSRSARPAIVSVLTRSGASAA